MLPMLKFAEKLAGVIHCRQRFEQGNIFSLWKEDAERRTVNVLNLGRADMESALGAYREVRICACLQPFVNFLETSIQLRIEPAQGSLAVGDTLQ
ncbi:hypothetical protein [Pseudomonas sp. RT6P73]